MEQVEQTTQAIEVSEEIRADEIDHGSRPMPDFVKKGLMRVQGGQVYLKAPYRVLWFREDHPEWTIETHLLTVNEQYCLARAEIKNEEGRLLATGHKQQAAKSFPAGHIEKAETGAVARALAVLGYGTHCGEFDEEDVADTPTGGNVHRGNAPQRTSARPLANFAAKSAANVNENALPARPEQVAAVQKICEANRWDEVDTAQKWYGVGVENLTQAQAGEMISKLNKLAKETAPQN